MVSTSGFVDRRTFVAGTAAQVACLTRSSAIAAEGLTLVAMSPVQMNGVACARDGRVFVSLPRWINGDTFSVGVVEAGQRVKAYPGNAWNAWQSDAPPGSRFVCVNAIHIDPRHPDVLWVVDAAAPAFGPIIPGGPKLVAIDLTRNEVSKSFALSTELVPSKGYLNDVRLAHGHAFMSESGTGAILVIDLSTGRGRRVLASHPSTKAVPGRVPVVDGRPIAAPNGSVPHINVDGIALSPDREWLHYAVPFGGWLWKIRVADLLDQRIGDDALAHHIVKVGALMPIGGMTTAPDGGLFLSDVEHHAIVHRAPDGALTTIIVDPLLEWPDASALDSSGTLFVAASQVNRMPAFNAGRDSVTFPFRVLKI